MIIIKLQIYALFSKRQRNLKKFIQKVSQNVVLLDIMYCLGKVNLVTYIDL